MCNVGQMDKLRYIISEKYPKLHYDTEYMVACLYGIIQDMKDFAPNISDELALQVRLIALQCVESASKVPRIQWPLTSLHLAAYCAPYEIFESLFRIYDYLDVRSSLGFTSAQFAAMKGHLRMLALLYRCNRGSIYFGPNGCCALDFITTFDSSVDLSWIRERDMIPYITRICAQSNSDIPSLGIVPMNRNTFSRVVRPVPVQFTDKKFNMNKEVSQVAFAKYHTIYLINGVAYSCGFGRYGKLGHGDEKDRFGATKIQFAEKVVCVGVGIGHSIICSRTKILLCGLNDAGQLGLGEKPMAVLPYILRPLENDRDEITACSTTDKLTIIILRSHDLLVAGRSTGSFFTRFSGNTFAYVRIPFGDYTESLAIIDTCIVRICSATRLNIITRERTYHISTCPYFIERCVGGFSTPDLNVVFSGACCTNSEDHLLPGCEEEGPGSFYLFAQNDPTVLQLLHFHDNETQKCICFVMNAVIAQNGKIVLIDKKGNIYEGYFNNRSRYSIDIIYVVDETGVRVRRRTRCQAYSPSHARCVANWHSLIVREPTDGSHSITYYTSYVRVSRVRAILPATNVFLTPDGRSKVMNLVEIDSRPAEDLLEGISSIEFPDGDKAKIICVNERNEELERFDAPLDALTRESEYFTSFFERWAPYGRNEIRVFAAPKVMKIFLSYSRLHCFTSEFTKYELMESLVFANELLCDDFFDAIVQRLFKPPVEMSDLQSLYSLARHMSSTKLYDRLSRHCALLFPYYLECGFINELPMDDIARIESNYIQPDHQLDRSLVENANTMVCTMNQITNRMREVTDHDNYVKNIIKDVLAVVKEPMEIDDLVAFCKCVKNGRSYKKAMKKQRQGIYASKVLETNAKNAGNNKATKTANRNNSNNNKNSEYEHMVRKVQPEQEVVNKKNPEPRKPEASASAHADADDSEKPQGSGISTGRKPKFTWGNNNNAESQFVSLADIMADEEKENKAGNGKNSVADITADEGEENQVSKGKKNEKKSKKQMKETSTSSKEQEPQPGTSRSWNMEASSTSHQRSFAQIMEEEETRRSDTTRQLSSRLTDINLEDRAMNELVEHYDGEASLHDISVSVTAERQVPEINDPFWPARS